MIYSVTLNPACDRTVTIRSFAVNQVNRIGESRQDPGGKSINVSKVIAALGGQSVATGILGGSTGRYIDAALRQMGLATQFVWTQANTRTNLKVVDPDNNTYTDINDAGEPVENAVLEQVLSLLLREGKPGDLAVLAGKLPKGAREDTYANWTRALREKGLSVYVDAEGETLRQAVSAAPALIKPNEKELADLTGAPVTTRQEVFNAAKALLAQGVGAVVVSLGAEGAICCCGEGCWQAKGLKVPVVSTVGAGDSMMAALALGEEQSLSMKERFRMAMAVSAAKVTVSGSQPPTMEMVNKLLEQVEIEDI